MRKSIYSSIPVHFEKYSNQVEDARFTRVKVLICHTGENKNGSYFSKDALVKMQKTLSNIPILGYISKGNDSKSDFNGHEEKLTIDDGGVKVVYYGQAYGTIPESNNSRFETKVCDDGVEREFLVCDGYIWNKFSDSKEIFDRDQSKSQSMELVGASVKGSFKKDKLFHFTEAVFDGICILGNDVQPAMVGSVIEKFSLSKFSVQMQELQDDFSAFQKELNSVKGGRKMDNINSLLEKYGITIEDLNVKNIKFEEMNEAEVELEIQKHFSLTSNQLNMELRKKLAEIETITDQRWGEVCNYSRYNFEDNKPEEQIVIAYDSKENQLVGFKYSQNNDAVEVEKETITKYKIDFVPVVGAEEVSTLAQFSHVSVSQAVLEAKENSLMRSFQLEKDEIEQKNQENISNLETRFSELMDKYAELESKSAHFESELKSKVEQEISQAKSKVFHSFNEVLSEEDVKELKAQSANFSVDEITEKLYAIAGKKNVKFSAEPNKPLQYQIPLDEKTNNIVKPYDNLWKI